MLQFLSVSLSKATGRLSSVANRFLLCFCRKSVLYVCKMLYVTFTFEPGTLKY